jgi:D-serine dehydratase
MNRTRDSLGLDTRLEQTLRTKEPTLWLNPAWQPAAEAFALRPLGYEAIQLAEVKLARFGILLAHLFPELASRGGIIESEVTAIPRLQAALNGQGGRWLIKGDHALPVAGSIKARGGIYEVLCHAERVAADAGLVPAHAPRTGLASPAARSLFSRHTVMVGSTGNLGLSIGAMAAALGFRAVVHMSAEAKAWKKDRLRRLGVEVVESTGDYAEAVAAGRRQALADPTAYFVDDENSELLFLGYAVAALRLRLQLAQAGVEVDGAHPLFVYLPCGVGGAPGGVTFGLRHVYGDNVHCFFAEPTASPCVFLALAASTEAPPSVHDLGIDNRTEADGLAVARASPFAVGMIRSLVSGVFTVPDTDLFEDLYRLERAEGMRIEPSAAAGFRGPGWVLGSAAGQAYLERRGLAHAMGEATHLIWTTGGAFLPAAEYEQFRQRGQQSLQGTS